jgi:hypothetical protein
MEPSALDAVADGACFGAGFIAYGALVDAEKRR